MPAPSQQRHTPAIAVLLGTTLLAGCALPRMSELSNRKGIDNSIPTVIKKDRPLDASPGIRPFCSGLAVSSDDLARAVSQITKFRLEHLHSITLGPACIELLKNGDAKLSIRVNETSTSSVDGKYRISTLELSPGRWERVIEISGAGFLKGEAFIRLSETDPVSEGELPAFIVDARFSPYFPVSLIVDGMSTGGPVPVYFRDRKTVRTDTIWAYSLLGSGAVLEDQFAQIRDARKRLDETAAVSLRRWDEAVPSLTPEQIETFERIIATERVTTFIRIHSTQVPETPESKRGVLSYRVVGVDQDFVYLYVPPWERLLRSSILLPVDKERGIFALPVDYTWNPAYDGFYQRRAPELSLESGRPMYTRNAAAIPEKFLSAIRSIDPHLVKLESDFGLPQGYHEISIDKKASPLQEYVPTTGRVGGLSTLVVPSDRTDEIVAEPRAMLAYTCNTLIRSITGGEVPGVNHPLSPKDAQVETEKIWPKLSLVVREANSMAAQVLLSLYDENVRLELLGLPRQERIAFSGYAARLKEFLNTTTLSIHPEVFQRLDQFSDEMQRVVTGHEKVAQTNLGDLKRLLLNMNASGRAAVEQVNPTKSKQKPDPLITDGVSWAFVSLSKLVEYECAQKIMSSSMNERLSKEIELLRKRGITFSRQESEEAVLYSLFSMGGVPVTVTEKLTSHWGSVSVPEYFLHFVNQTPLARMELGSVVNSLFATGRGWRDHSTPTSLARVFVSSPKNQRPELLYIDPSDPLADSAIQGMKMTGDYLERTEYFGRLKEDIRKELVTLLTDNKR